MYTKALLIYNGNAGKGEIEDIFKIILPILSKKIKHLMLSKTDAEGEAKEIAKQSGEEYEIVIVLGGDGTLHEVINGIAELNHPPQVGILPAGTCNDFARSLNIPLKLDEAAKSILKGKTKSVNIGKINNHYFTNFVGIGLVTKISENINNEFKNTMGKMSYYTAAIKSLGKKEDFEFTLKTENEKIKEKAGMIVILNGHYVGSTLVPVKSIDVNDNLLDIFIVYEAGFALLIKYLTQKEVFEQQVSENEIKHIQAKEISIKTTTQMPVDTDGEIYLDTPIDVSVLNKKIEFIVG